jgi:hypothetical protein
VRHLHKHISVLFLVLLIFISSVGITIVSSFCGGCNVEYSKVVYNPDEVSKECSCCHTIDGDEKCCTANTTGLEHHHEHKATTAKLNVNTPEAKSKTSNLYPLVLNLFYACSNFKIEIRSTQLFQSDYSSFLPPDSGRKILSLICILRN